MKFRSQIKHQVNDHRLLRTSSFTWVDLASHQEQSPNENLNLVVRIKVLNLFLHSSN